MKKVLPLYIWFALGAVGFGLSRWDYFDFNTQWLIVFLFTKSMPLLLWYALWKKSSSEKIEYKLTMIAILIASLLDILSDVAAQRNQGNWKEHFSHAFGIVTILAVVTITLSNKSSIIKWLKSRLKS